MSDRLPYLFSPWDFLIFGFLILVSLAYTVFFVSRGKLLPVLVATYMSFVLVEFAPFLTTPKAEFKLAAFAGAFLVILFVLSRVILQSPVGAETFGLIASFLLSLAQTGFLTAVIVSHLPPEITREFSTLTSRIFVGKTVLFYWAAAPIILLLLLGHKANQEVG